MREGRRVSDGTLRRVRSDSQDADRPLSDLVIRDLANHLGGRRYAEYLLDEDRADGQPSVELFCDTLHRPGHGGGGDRDGVAAPGHGHSPAARHRYDRLDEIDALFDDGQVTAAQVARRDGLSLMMTNRYLSRLLSTGRLTPTAPARSPQPAARTGPIASPPQRQPVPSNDPQAAAAAGAAALRAPSGRRHV